MEELTTQIARLALILENRDGKLQEDPQLRTLPDLPRFANFDNLQTELLRIWGLNLPEQCKTVYGWWHQNDLKAYRRNINHAKQMLPFSSLPPHAPNEACVEVFYQMFLDAHFQDVKQHFLLVPQLATISIPDPRNASKKLFPNGPETKPDMILGFGSYNFIDRPRVILEIKQNLAQDTNEVLTQVEKYLKLWENCDRRMHSSPVIAKGSPHLACIALDLDSALIFWIQNVEEHLKNPRNQIRKYKLQWKFTEILRVLKNKGEGIEATSLKDFYALFEFIKAIAYDNFPYYDPYALLK